MEGRLKPGRVRTRNPSRATLNEPVRPSSLEHEVEAVHVDPGLRASRRELPGIRVSAAIGIGLDLADHQSPWRSIVANDQRIENQERFRQHDAARDPHRCARDQPWQVARPSCSHPPKQTRRLRSESSRLLHRPPFSPQPEVGETTCGVGENASLHQREPQGLSIVPEQGLLERLPTSNRKRRLSHRRLPALAAHDVRHRRCCGPPTTRSPDTGGFWPTARSDAGCLDVRRPLRAWASCVTGGPFPPLLNWTLLEFNS